MMLYINDSRRKSEYKVRGYVKFSSLSDVAFDKTSNILGVDLHLLKATKFEIYMWSKEELLK